MEPRALEAVLRHGAPSLERTSFLGRALGPELDRDPFGVTHEVVSSRGETLHLRIVLTDPEPGESARLVRAARVLAKGKPPAIPQASGFGTSDGLAWLELPPARGTPLATRLAEGPLPPFEAAALVAALARSLGELHMRGGFHGAIRPGSVWITPSGIELRNAAFSGWSPWRLELARSLGSSATGEGSLDALASAAPEQLATRDASSARSVAGHNDVYGLGALLYALLVGRPPYSAEAPLEVLDLVLRGSPLRPRKINPDVPRALEETVLRCLAKNPAHRPASALALAEQLGSAERKALESSTGALLALHHASDASGVRPPEAPPKERPPWKLIGAGAALVVIAVLAVFAAFAHERRRSFDVEIARGDDLLAKGDAAGALAAFEQARAIDPGSAAVEARIERAREAVGAVKKKGEARSFLTKALTATPRSAARIDLLEQAVAADPGLVEAQRERARYLVAAAEDEPRGSEGRPRKVAAARDAVKALLKAGGSAAEDALLDARERIVERMDPSAALERAAVADPRSAAGYAAAALLALAHEKPQDAAIAIERALAEQPLDARLLLARARIRRAGGSLERARTDLEAAVAADPESREARAALLDGALEARDLERARRVLDDHPREAEHDPDLLAGRAYVHLLEGKRDSAGEDSARALELDPASPRARLVRARLALAKGDLAAVRREAAVADREAPIDLQIIARGLQGDDLSDVASERVELLSELGQALDQTAERALARKILDRAVLLAPDDARTRVLRGQVLSGLGDFEHALIDADFVVQHHARDVRGHALRARVLEALARSDEATVEYGTIIDLAPSRAEFRAFRGFALYDLRRFDEARADLETFLEANPAPGPLVDRARSVLEKLK